MTHFPLEGVTVVDLTQIYNGPYATYLLALAGATVIKIEPPGGESLRRRGVVGGAGLPFAMLNGAKESICLDLKSELGKRAFLDLVKDADVVVENFSPGAMDRLGLGCDRLREVNPALIYASSSGFGRSGPYRSYPAMDLTVQAMSGVMETTGFPDRPPVKAGPALCDFFAGIHLHSAILTALFDRARTGTPRRVEVAMQDAVYASLSSSLGLWWGGHGDSSVPPRTGNRHGGMAEAPYNVYPTSDGWVAVICVGEGHWRKLLATMGREDLGSDPRFADLKSRVAHIDLVDEIVSAWTSTLPKQEIFDRLMAAGVPAAPVRNLDEVVHDPNMHARGALQYQDHPDYGRIIVQQSPIRIDGLEPMTIPPSHALGADTAAILRARTGLSEDEIAQMIGG
ncbi:MAG: CoA transferase [Proteobacteria bacterium]|nr:CoA transferase [Pseudomonadota bacterium]